MLESVKPLIVVLFLELLVFATVKSTCLQFMDPQTFARRRMVWLLLTISEFLAPNIWVFAAVALPLIYWAGTRDEHPAALYLMLFMIVPPVSVPIPMPAINQLFELTYPRMVSLALIVPTVIRLVRSGQANREGLAKVDLLLLAFGALQIAVFFPYESITQTIRRSFLFGIDVFALYFVFSRGVTSKAAMRDTMASFCLACILLVPVLAFESLRGWLLFIGIPDQWGSPNAGAFLMRGNSLRAQASLGHSLTMGFMLALAFGFWVYLSGRLPSRAARWAGGIALWIGLFAAFSRAPWLVAVTIAAIYMVTSTTGRQNLFKAALASLVIAVPLAMTPPGERIIASLPFIGTVDQSNVEYRQQLADVSWQLIQLNPFFGSPFVTNYMEEMRQGQGIIDIVNTYAYISLFFGLVGCALFVACFVYPMVRAAYSAFRARQGDEDDGNIGIILIASVLGTMLMMATGSFGGTFEFVSWALCGLCCAYTALMFRRAEVSFAGNAAERFVAQRQT
jgi:hypothetical protein